MAPSSHPPSTAEVAPASADPAPAIHQHLRHVPATGAAAANTLPTPELRRHFLCDDLVVADAVAMVHWETDRTIVGCAQPVHQSLELVADAELRADYFCQRRELGIVNLGAAGAITVDGQRQAMAPRDFLYVGAGNTRVVFHPAADAPGPPLYYFVSYPAHRQGGIAHLPFSACPATQLGAEGRCNSRQLYPMITPDNVETCQLVMGMTLLAPGSAWNTMPPHTHARRSEVYFYFALEDDALVIHLMGQPDATRHLVVRNQQAVLSPGWSIHSGVGTSHYGFIWAMGGENKTFTDMDPVDPRTFA
jgi:4-deoxy-L-threo-5-hexosulose-uronate ketol-isomerase